MRNNAFQANIAAIAALADIIFGTANDPKDHQQWKELIKLLNTTNEISRLYYFKHKGEYDYGFAWIGNEQKEEERLRRLGHRPYEVVVIKTNPGWTLDDFQELYKISMLDDIAKLALKIFNRIKHPCFLSGPISANETCPSLEENSARFYKTIWKLHQANQNIFDQTPFIEKINIILDQVHIEKRMALVNRVLEEVFYPIIESGRIVRHFRMDNWETSYGARCEVAIGDLSAVPAFQLKSTFASLSVKDAQLYLMNLKSCKDLKKDNAS